MSDWDGDIVFTTDNEIILNNIYPNKNVITYAKTSAPAQKLTKSNITKTDLKSFDSKVGTITNYSTSFLAMLAGFKKNSKEYAELVNRIKLLRRYIGDSIDVAKGIKMKPFPKDWKSWSKVLDTDTEEEKQEKYYHNNLVSKKKPYFMIYIYEKLMEDYKKYKKENNVCCKEHFGCKINELVRKKHEERTEEENKFINRYFYKMPVIKTNCIINELCWYIEGIDFGLKYDNKTVASDEIISILMNSTIKKNEEKFKKVEELYKTFNKTKGEKMRIYLAEHYNNKHLKKDVNSHYLDDSNEHNIIKDEFYNLIREQAIEICPNVCELANYAVEVCYINNPKREKDFAWNVCREGLMLNISQNRSEIIEIPVNSKEGVEFLGKYYTLKEV